jgi:hypothetical protein
MVREDDLDVGVGMRSGGDLADCDGDIGARVSVSAFLSRLDYTTEGRRGGGLRQQAW